jgi:hypothetical protein
MLALDSNVLFFTNAGAVKALPLDGSAERTLATGADDFVPIIVSGGYVYFARATTNPSYDDGALVRVAVGGSSTTTLATYKGSVSSIAIDAQNAYFAAATSDQYGAPILYTATVNAVPIGGGTVTPLATKLEAAFALFVAGDRPYWADPSGVASTKLTGGQPVINSTPHQPSCVYVSATNVFWAGADISGPGNSGVWSTDLSGGSLVTIAQFNFDFQPTSLTLDGSSVYWVNQIGLQSLGSVQKAPVAGGDTQMIAGGLTGPTALVVDTDGVYVATGAGIFHVTPK